MAARSRGNGTNFDWLRKSCDLSTCDLSPDGNPEKYGRPMKSAISLCRKSLRFTPFGKPRMSQCWSYGRDGNIRVLTIEFTQALIFTNKKACTSKILIVCKYYSSHFISNIPGFAQA